MELTEEQIDRALGMAYRELADDAADEMATDPDDLMRIVLDGLGEFEGSADQALLELVRQDLLMAWVGDSRIVETGNSRSMREYSIDRIALTEKGMERGQRAAGAL